jgi:arginase
MNFLTIIALNLILAKSSLPNSDCFQSIRVIGAAIQAGSPKSGTQLAPAKIRTLGLETRLEKINIRFKDVGDIKEIGHPSSSFRGYADYYRLEPALFKLKQFAERALLSNEFPLIIGGDHSVTLPIVSALAKINNRRRESTGVIIFDAHEDAYLGFPVYTFLHNTFLLKLIGKRKGSDRFPEAFDRIRAFIKPAHVVIVGKRVRAPFDPDLGFKYVTLDDLNKISAEDRAHKILNELPLSVKSIHLSIDLDVLDPNESPGVNYPSVNGMSVAIAKSLIGQLARSRRIRSADFVEYVPHLDRDDKTGVVMIDLMEELIKVIGQPVPGQVD